MKKTIYFIPGFGEISRDHQSLLDSIKAKNYRVIEINPDWVQAISDQVFHPKKDSVIIGFSYGALLAYLVVKKYPCKKVIFASMSPINTFTYDETYNDHRKYMAAYQARRTARDILKINVNLNSLKTPHVTLAGEREKISADFLIPNTGHKLTKKYISTITELIDYQKKPSHMTTLNDIGILFKTAKLKNGIRLYHFERKGAPIQIQFVFNNGSANDPNEKAGLAHFLEHMVVAGTKHLPSKDLLAIEFENLGANFSAVTTLESIKFNFTISRKDELTSVFKIIYQIFFETAFLEKSFTEEKKAIMAEIGIKDSTPTKYVWELYRKAFFNGSAMGQSTLGNKKTLGMISLDDLKKLFTKMALSGGISVIAAGDVSLHSLERKISTLQFNTQKHMIQKPVFKRLDLGRVQSIEEPFQTNNTFIVCGYKTKKLSIQEYALLSILRYHLSSPRSGLLIKKLRYEKGLVYGCDIHIAVYMACATFCIHTSCQKKDLRDVVEIIKNEFKNIREGSMTEKMLDEIRSRIIKSIPMRYETTQAIIENHTVLLSKFNTTYTLDDFNRVLSKITPLQIKNFARKYLTEKNFASATLIPK